MPIQTGGLDPARPIVGGLTPGYTGPGANPGLPNLTPDNPPIPPMFGGAASMPIAHPFMGGFGGSQSFQSLIPQMGALPSYNPGGGYMPSPIGGYWNQIAQRMAGPMFMPQGASILGGQSNPLAPQQPSSVNIPPPVGTPTPITSRLPTPPTTGPYNFNAGIAPGAPKPPVVQPTVQAPIPAGGNIGALGSLGALYGGGIGGMPGITQGARGGLLQLRQMRA